MIWNKQGEEPLTIRRYTSLEHKGVIKYVPTFADGDAVETVLVPHSGNYFSLCVSSSVGCPVHCRFCSTGREPFVRMLRYDEIVWQLQVAGGNFSKNLKVISFMGMGDPLLNYENVIKAAKCIQENWSIKRIIISTIGIPNRIRQLSNDIDVELYLSLVSTDDTIRSQLVPYRPYYPINELLDALETYSSNSSKPVTISYLLLARINDRNVDANRLINMLQKRDFKIMVSLREFCPNGSPFAVSANMSIFDSTLREAGIETEIFVSKGKDINAGCGQLVQHVAKTEKALALEV